MHSKKILVAYGIVSIIELAMAHSSVRYVTKPLLMILLAAYVYAGNLNLAAQRSLFITLLFAWLGDVFLLIPGNNPLFFQLGLASFLFMQVAYIRQFIRFGAFKWSWGLIPVLLYVVGFLAYLYPLLPAALVGPVIVYALALGSMLYFAFQLRVSALTLGAVLFVLSDSLLAFAKFKFEYPWNSFAVMSTYILAQLLLIQALCKLHAQR
jgi:uncharacterized membrane protein YhhN